MQKTAVVQKLVSFQRGEIVRHLKRPFLDDCRLGFESYMSDTAIGRYVDGIGFVRDKVFGIFDTGLVLSGEAHLALESDSGTAELGLSVDSAHRGNGYGFTLLNRGKLHAQNLTYREHYMHCHTVNQIMIH
jgi:RimJ/RimL family protein N-acetyltransferase